MPAFNFTDRTRRTLQAAKDEAAAMHHEIVGTEHVLLALLSLDGGKAVAILAALGVDGGRLRAKTRGRVVAGAGSNAPDAPLPYTSGCKKVLEYAMLEARDGGHLPVGTEHLLVGLLRERKGIAAKVLAEAGIDLKMVRREIDGRFASTDPVEE